MRALAGDSTMTSRLAPFAAAVESTLVVRAAGLVLAATTSYLTSRELPGARSSDMPPRGRSDARRLPQATDCLRGSEHIAHLSPPSTFRCD